MTAPNDGIDFFVSSIFLHVHLSTDLKQSFAWCLLIKLPCLDPAGEADTNTEERLLPQFLC